MDRVICIIVLCCLFLIGLAGGVVAQVLDSDEEEMVFPEDNEENGEIARRSRSRRMDNERRNLYDLNRQNLRQEEERRRWELRYQSPHAREMPPSQEPQRYYPQYYYYYPQ